MTRDKRGGCKEGLCAYEMATLPKWKLDIVCKILDMPDKVHNKILHYIFELIVFVFILILKYYLTHSSLEKV